MKINYSSDRTEEALKRDGLGLEDSYFHYYVAEKTDAESKVPELIGYCLYYLNYSTFDGKGIFLEELYIRPSYQKSGIGSALLRKIAKDVLERGCTRIELNVFKWNTPARRFYEKIGARNLTETENMNLFVLDNPNFQKFALE